MRNELYGNDKDGGALMKRNMKPARFLVFARTLLTGLIGGAIWGTLGVVMYYFNFTEVNPKKFMLRPWKSVEWLSGWLGDIVTIIILAILSMIVALIYYILFKKVYSIWMGAVYGVIIWAIIFFLVQPLFPGTKQLTQLNKETIISTICLFILYGTFIGYAISYDYFDTYVLEKERRSNTN